MAFTARARFDWQLRTRTLALGERTLLMGIVNVTPDSFSDGGLYQSPDRAVEHALRLLDDGADLIDLGAESTRPDAVPISSGEEQARLLPALEALLKARPEAIVSVDTYHAATARCAVAAGAEVINDVSGLHWDAAMAETLAELTCGAVLMHARGRAPEWAAQPPLPPAEVLPTVLAGLTATLTRAKVAGIARSRIVLDPGFGFGKRGEENMALHAGFARLTAPGYPLLVGTSRKRFLTAGLPDATDDQRAHACTASNVAAILAGAHIVRVHDIVAASAGAQFSDRFMAAVALSMK